jgi:hypothetical protein
MRLNGDRCSLSEYRSHFNASDILKIGGHGTSQMSQCQCSRIAQAARTRVSAPHEHYQTRQLFSLTIG